MGRRICKRCGKREAIYIRRQRNRAGRMMTIVGADDSHDMCLRCKRSDWDRQRAHELKES